MIPGLTWFAVIVTALADSINPCAIGVLILMVSTLLVLSHNRNKMVYVGVIYILAVFVTYFLAGIGLLLFIQKFNLAEPLGIFVGSLVILMGLIEVKDFFWYGKGITLAIPVSQSKKIEKYVKRVTIPGAILLGIFVSAVELPCTGGPYLAITTLLARQPFNLQAIFLLLVYNFIFVLPLIVILLLVYFGMSAKKLERLRKEGRGWMRLIIGLVMISLGILLILFATGYINLAATYY